MSQDADLYFDWNSTTPPLPAAVLAMTRALADSWGNPSSTHRHGGKARSHIERARQAIADLAGADVRDVILTSGGTEANNLGLRSAVALCDNPHPVIFASKMDHPSIVRCVEALVREGAVAEWIPSQGSSGVIDLSFVEERMPKNGGSVLALSSVNHETGVIQPVVEALKLAVRFHAVVHLDAVQAFGKLPAPQQTDFLALTAHKFRGPKGMGALVTRPHSKVASILYGGSQERGLRPGTVDPVVAAGVAVAASHAQSSPTRYAGIAKLRDRFEESVLPLFPGAFVAGAASPRVPHVTNIVFPDLVAPELVAALDVEGLSVSAGSACSAGTVDPSPVLFAMFGPKFAKSGIRVSFGETTTEEANERAIAIMKVVLPRFC